MPQQLYDQFTSTYAQLQSQNGSNPQAGLLQRLNIDLAQWLTDLKNEGTEDVEGQKTIHISGKANVPQIVGDLKTIAKDAGSSVGNVDVSQLDQLNGTIKSGDVDVNTGETDKLLRRVGLSLDLKPPAGTPGAPDSLELHLQLNLADVNKPQTIQAPANAQPLDASALQQLGIDPLGTRWGAAGRARLRRRPARVGRVDAGAEPVGHSGVPAVPLAGGRGRPSCSGARALLGQ